MSKSTCLGRKSTPYVYQTMDLKEIVSTQRSNLLISRVLWEKIEICRLRHRILARMGMTRESLAIIRYSKLLMQMGQINILSMSVHLQNWRSFQLPKQSNLVFAWVFPTLLSFSCIPTRLTTPSNLSRKQAKVLSPARRVQLLRSSSFRAKEVNWLRRRKKKKKRREKELILGKATLPAGLGLNRWAQELKRNRGLWDSLKWASISFRKLQRQLQNFTG